MLYCVNNPLSSLPGNPGVTAGTWMETTAMAMAMAMAMAIASAGLMVKSLFLFRLVGIVDPQWHFGSTLANRFAL